MKIYFHGGKVSKVDKRFLRFFTKWVLGRFCSPQELKHIRITYRFVSPSTAKTKDKQDLKEYKAWVEAHSSRKKFKIVINTKTIKRQRKNPLFRLKTVLECAGHELMHIKQYVKHEMKDYANGNVGYKNKRYKQWEEGEHYWFSPWEIEAYGFELGLYSVFKKLILQDPIK